MTGSARGGLDPRPGPTGRPEVWSGVDSTPGREALVLQFDVLAEGLDSCLDVIGDLAEGLRGIGVRPGFERLPGDRPTSDPTSLIGVSVRLFKGEWTAWRDDSDHSPRWGHDVSCPPSLRTMQAKRDDEFPAFATEPERTGHETDLCVVVESHDRAVDDAVHDVVARLEAGGGLRLRRSHEGTRNADGRDPFGFHDEISNLQHLREQDPTRYRGHVFTTDPSGEVDGTYLAFRRYRARPERLPVDGLLHLPASRGVAERTLSAEQVIGRCRASGLVVEADTGRLLPPEPDEAQGSRALPLTHLRKANPRGRGTTPFGADVRVRDVRILRRSYPYTRTVDGRAEAGMLFMAFQADIQVGGFEFIHNEWLMSDFNGAPDPLLAPESGLVEPLTGCYYFVPRDQAGIAGVVHRLVTERGA